MVLGIWTYFWWSWSSIHGRIIERVRLSFPLQYHPLISDECRATCRIQLPFIAPPFFNCEVATNRSTLERLGDGRQFLVVGFLWPLILCASHPFDSFDSSVHCHLFSSSLTYLSVFIEATTAYKSTHHSVRLNSSSRKQQVDS